MTLQLRPYQERCLADLWHWFEGDFALPKPSILLRNSGREGASNTRPALNIQPVVEAAMSDRPDTGNPSATQEIISRAEAKARGLTNYFTGKPCSRGHVAARQITNFNCVVCRNEAQKRRVRENPEAISRANRKHYYANHERMLARAAAYSKANPEKNRANALKQYRKNPERYAVYSRNRKAMKKAAEGKHTAAEIRNLYERQSGKCANCRTLLKPGFHADHIVPLIRGGSNWITNIQLLCPPCNLSKKALDPIEWAQREGRLL